MSSRNGFAYATFGLLVAVSVGVLACDANVETVCVGGDGTCNNEQPYDPASVSSSVGAGGGGGGGCLSGCDIENPSGLTGDLPCEVEAIFVSNCQRCHTDPTTGGAPFTLQTYEQTQELYFTVPIWFRMKNAIETDFMPLQPPKLNPDEKISVIEDWICKCAPPRDPNETCN